MGLDKTCKEYYYNLGRVAALVEIMRNLENGNGFLHKVTVNAFAYLPFHLNKALAMDRHNLHKELLEAAEVVLLDGRDMPHGILTAYDHKGSFMIGYYHEKHYLSKTYHGIYGKEETTVTESIPEEVKPVENNNVIELER